MLNTGLSFEANTKSALINLELTKKDNLLPQDGPKFGTTSKHNVDKFVQKRRKRSKRMQPSDGSSSEEA